MITIPARVRWIGWMLAGGFVGLSTIDCAVPTGFTCINANQCGGGQCIAGGCAFLSTECPSGLRYGDLSPEPLAGKCVGVDEGVAEDSDSGESTTLETSTSSDASSTGESSTSESSTSESSTSESSTDVTDVTDNGTTTDAIPDTAIAHYSFDEINGATIVDGTGHGFDAAMENGQSTAPAIVGEGLNFDNLDRVIVPAAVLADHPDFTLEFYVQVSQSALLRQFLFYYGDEVVVSTPPMMTFYIEYANAPQQTGRAVWTDAGNTITGLIGTTSLADGQWHHVAITFQGGQGMAFYVDHFLEDEAPQIAGLFNPNLPWIQIGGIPTGFGGFTGALDELRFSDGVLTLDQMQPAP